MPLRVQPIDITLRQMPQARSNFGLIVITGLPGTGKTTLARELARSFRVPLLAKDMIKEPLLDVLGAGDRPHSRRMSDASFSVLFALARELLTTGGGLILEGNFRAGEHEPEFLRVLPANAQPAVAITQVLCRVEESLRIERLQRRAVDPSRHAGHRDAELVAMGAEGGAAFLDIPGRRVEFDSRASPPDCEELMAVLGLGIAL